MSQRRDVWSSLLAARVMRAGLFAVAIALVLGACGGGDDGAANSASPPGSPGNPGTPATTLTAPVVQVQQQGESYSLTFVSASTGNTYRWQRSSDGGQTWSDVGGTFTTPTALTFEADQLSMNGLQYRLNVSNGTDSASSTPFILTVAASVPTIHSQPQDQSVLPGAEARFVVGAYGASRSYRWQRSADAGANWQDLAGETSASLTLPTVAPESAGLFRVVVTTTLGSVTSREAVLGVQTVQTTIASAYVLHAEENKVTRFSIMSDGAVVPAPTPAFTLPVFPSLAYISPTREYLAVYDGISIATLPFDGHGSLSHPWGLVRPTGGIGHIAMSPDGVAAYALAATSRVSQYRFGSSGLESLSPAIVITRGMVGAVVGPNSDWLIGAAIGGPDTQLLTYPIAAERTLGTTARSQVLGAGVIVSVSLNAAGSRLYAQTATGRVGQHILQYQVDANGALSPLSPSSVASIGNDHMVITRDGRCLFSPVVHKSTTRAEAGAIATFRIQDDGTLMPSMPPVQDVLRSLSAIAVTPDSRYLITVHASDNRLYVYRIAASCNLALVRDFHHTEGVTPYGLVVR